MPLSRARAIAAEPDRIYQKAPGGELEKLIRQGVAGFTQGEAES